MDFSKYPLEKLVYFVAGVVPGLVALLIFDLASPDSFGWFFTLGFLGYKTKLGLILAIAFVIGNTLTRFLGGLFSALGGVIGYATYKSPHSYDVAPWRDRQWRAVVKKILGEQTPNDTLPMAEWMLDQRRKMVDFLPEEQKAKALLDLGFEKLNSEIDDGNWAMWYDHYHQIVLQPREQDFVWHVQNGLNFNLETTAVYVLIGALVVPSVRHWWCIVPACMWLLLLVAEVYTALQQLSNKWLTLSAQVKYLSGVSRSGETPEKAAQA